MKAFVSVSVYPNKQISLKNVESVKRGRISRICYLHPFGRHTFASPLASANSGEISLGSVPD